MHVLCFRHFGENDHWICLIVVIKAISLCNFVFGLLYAFLRVVPTHSTHFTCRKSNTMGIFFLCTSVVFLNANHAKLPPLARKRIQIWLNFLISNNHVLLGGRNGHKGGTPELFLWLIRPLKRYPLVKKKGLNQDWCFTTKKRCQSRELIYIQGELPLTFFN